MMCEWNRIQFDCGCILTSFEVPPSGDLHYSGMTCRLQVDALCRLRTLAEQDDYSLVVLSEHTFTAAAVTPVRTIALFTIEK